MIWYILYSHYLYITYTASELRHFLLSTTVHEHLQFSVDVVRPRQHDTSTGRLAIPLLIDFFLNYYNFARYFPIFIKNREIWGYIKSKTHLFFNASQPFSFHKLEIITHSSTWKIWKKIHHKIKDTY